ncbi:superoxide dismutase, partial [Halobacteriales archaeon QH_3_68_24]
MAEHSDPELPPLPYDYDALEPHISEQVLTWHHDTHHQGYVNGLASAEEKLANARESGDYSATAGALGNVTHNGCGHYLHTLFWDNMDPNGGGEPDGDLRARIEEDFGSYEGWKG